MHSASKFTLKMVSVYLITQLKSSPLRPALAARLVQLPSKIHPINLLLAIALIFFIINTSSLTNIHNISLHLPVYGVYGLFITHHYERHTLGLLVIMGAWLLSRMGFTQTLFQIQPTLHRNEIRMFSFQP